MLYKGGIFKLWSKKQTIAIQKNFFDTLPELPQVSQDKADIAWVIYDLVFNAHSLTYNLTLVDTVYTEFAPALLRITTPSIGRIEDFLGVLQGKLNAKLGGEAPDTVLVTDLF